MMPVSKLRLHWFNCWIVSWWSSDWSSSTGFVSAEGGYGNIGSQPPHPTICLILLLNGCLIGKVTDHFPSLVSNRIVSLSFKTLTRLTRACKSLLTIWLKLHQKRWLIICAGLVYFTITQQYNTGRFIVISLGLVYSEALWYSFCFEHRPLTV